MVHGAFTVVHTRVENDRTVELQYIHFLSCPLVHMYYLFIYKQMRKRKRYRVTIRTSQVFEEC